MLGNSTELQWLRITEDNWQSQLWIAAALTSLLCLLFAWQLIQRRVLQPKLAAIALLISVGIGLVNLKMPGLAPLCLLLCIGVALTHTRLIWLNLFLLGALLLQLKQQPTVQVDFTLRQWRRAADALRTAKSLCASYTQGAKKSCVNG